MYKLLNKIAAHWSQKCKKNSLYVFVMLGEMLAFGIILLRISIFAGSLLVKTTYFARFSSADISINIMLIFLALFFLLLLYIAYQNEREHTKAKEQLANRTVSDYVKKHQKYVDIVEGLLHSSENYSTVRLEDNWVKSFDINLASTAWQCHQQKHNFTDFEIAACLMYALTRIPSADGSNINLQFAFNCVKSIIATPSIYNCNYLSGDELALEKTSSLKEISIHDLEDAFNATILQILEVYISQRDNFSKVVNLADFLHTFYLYCEK